VTGSKSTPTGSVVGDLYVIVGEETVGALDASLGVVTIQTHVIFPGLAVDATARPTDRSDDQISDA
jgi:hypothetical protein